MMGFLDRLTFDPASGSHADLGMRYMMIKPEALMGVLLELPPDARPAVLEAMARAVFTQGGKSARTYRATGESDGEALLDTIRATAGELGWGVWTFARPDARTITLEVANSPFAAGYGPAPFPVCAMIRGMLQATGALVLGEPVVVIETACAAMDAPVCTFRITPAAS